MTVVMTKEDLVDALVEVVDCVSGCPKCEHCKDMAVQALDLVKTVTGKGPKREQEERRRKIG